MESLERCHVDNVADNSVKSFEITELKSQLAELKQENEELHAHDREQVWKES